MRLNDIINIIRNLPVEEIMSAESRSFITNWCKQNNSEAVTELERQLIKELEVGPSFIVRNDWKDSVLKKLSTLRSYELKINKLKNKIAERQNIGIDIITIIEDNDLISTIHARAERNLNLYIQNRQLHVDKEIIVASLSVIALIKYDGKFYDHVADVYDELYCCFSEQRIRGAITEILTNYLSVEERSKSLPRYINAVINNAIVPQYYLPSFFEFVFDIYKINFEYELSDDVYSDFKFVFDGIRSIINDESDELKISTTNKTYKLIKTTQRMIENPETEDKVIDLCERIVAIIDDYYWDREPSLKNAYYEYGFNNWHSTIQKSNERKIGTRTDFTSRWEPKFALSNDKVFIIPPRHRVKSQYDYRDIVISIFNGNTLLYENTKPVVHEIIGGYAVSLSKIELEQPLGELRYTVKCGETVLYDSKEKLHRTVIAFDQDGKEIRNDTDYDGVVDFCTAITDNPNEMDRVKTYYMMSSQRVSEGDSFWFGDVLFRFSAKEKAGVVGTLEKDLFVRSLDENKVLEVYTKLDLFVFECESSPEKVQVFINEKPYKLSDFENVVDSSNAKPRVKMIPNIADAGIYNVRVLESVNGALKALGEFEFVYDPNYNFDEEILGTNQSSINLQSCFISYDDYIAANEFDEALFNFEWNGITYNYAIPIGLPMYKIGDSSWNSFENELWIGDINKDTTLYIRANLADVFELRDQYGKQLIDENVQLKKRGLYYEANLSFLNTYRSGRDFIKLFFFKESKLISWIECYCNCVLEKETVEFIYTDGLLTLKASYKGKGRVFATLLDASTQEKLVSKQIVSSETVDFPDVEPLKEYIVCFSEKAKGLSLKSDRIMWQVSKIFFSEESLVNRFFKIETIEYGFDCKTMELSSTYIRVEQYFGNGTYEVKLLQKSFYSGKPFYFNEINPVIAEICARGFNNNLELQITKDDDGLLLDKDRATVLNSLDDKMAEDIYSYNMSLKQRS